MESDAMDHVAGYSIYNDVSVRDYQRHAQQIAAGKNFVGTGPFGPWLVTTDEVPDPTTLKLETRVNGATVQSSDTSHLIFSIPRLISYSSDIFDLMPGDVIATGTPEDVARVALFLAWLVTAWRSARRAQRIAKHSASPDLCHLGEGIEIALLAFAMSAFFYPVAYHFYFYLVGGLAALALAAFAHTAAYDARIAAELPDRMAAAGLALPDEPGLPGATDPYPPRLTITPGPMRMPHGGGPVCGPPGGGIPGPRPRPRAAAIIEPREFPIS
jgi:hypothetical protein